MRDINDGAAGRFLFGAWMARKRLAETRRPRLTRLLSWFVVACGVLFAVQGLLTGWFIGLLTPSDWGLDVIRLTAPYVSAAGWAGGICMILVGVGGAVGGLALRKPGRFGPKHTLLFYLTVLAVGIVIIYSGIRFEAPALIVTGVLDIVGAITIGALLGLCWYTLDPLGLHWPIGHTFRH